VSVPLTLADTTVLNNFAQVGRPELLQQAFPSLSAPRAVREELAAGERLGRVPVVDWSWLGLVDLRDAESLRAAALQRVIQAGEAACLAVVEARGGLVLTDDSAARRLAGTLGLRVSGTLVALARLVAREILSLPPGETLLAEMIARGLPKPGSISPRGSAPLSGESIGPLLNSSCKECPDHKCLVKKAAGAAGRRDGRPANTPTSPSPGAMGPG
jgi:predicted nucleic acid-binding protein